MPDIESTQEFTALQRSLQIFMQSLKSDPTHSEVTPSFYDARQSAYRLVSVMNELAWEVWDRPFLPELGAPDPDGPYGYSEPHVIATFVMEEFDTDNADQAIEGVNEALQREGLFLAKIIYVPGDSGGGESSFGGEGGDGAHNTPGPSLRRVISRIRLPWDR